jgi:hypothetical protein
MIHLMQLLAIAHLLSGVSVGSYGCARLPAPLVILDSQPQGPYLTRAVGRAWVFTQ